MIIELSARSKVFYISFFCEQRRNPAFSDLSGKKAGFLSREDIENLWLGIYNFFSSRRAHFIYLRNQGCPAYVSD
ncbi:Uncharacterized protein dnm_047870 [Desulfonema magnum]|uniref:Uncharacterized protein n=1 Tax=Desulfonema magnum TaxID=45655 RepID=A0A975GPF3_9BACT|nr:Uncharacterized protein dnm_047870 [Desulfonema magnum]